MAFALIYGFCQDKKSTFRGSIPYISGWTNTTDRQTQNVLNELQSENLIVKIPGNNNGVDCNEYTVNFKEVERLKNFTPEIISPLKKFHKTPEKISPERVKKFPGTGEKISPNNIVYNIDDNIGIERAPKKLQLETENEPEISDGLKYELEAYKKAARVFCEIYLDLNPDWKNAKFALPYFENEQKNGNWFRLQIPTTAKDKQRWIGQHYAGIEKWARGEHKYAPQKNGSPATIPGGYTIPKPDYSPEQ